MELLFRRKKRQTAKTAGVCAFEMIVEKVSAKCGFGAVIKQNAGLLIGQGFCELGDPFGTQRRQVVALFRYFVCHSFTLSPPECGRNDAIEPDERKAFKPDRLAVVNDERRDDHGEHQRREQERRKDEGKYSAAEEE